VAEVLQRAGLATLLLDLLPGAPVALHQGMELSLACQSLLAAVDWASQEPTLRALPQGLFGGSTGAAVALEVAALRPERIGAVVCRGGRPDLAFEALGLVRCPTC